MQQKSEHLNTFHSSSYHSVIADFRTKGRCYKAEHYDQWLAGVTVLYHISHNYKPLPILQINEIRQKQFKS